MTSFETIRLSTYDAERVPRGRLLDGSYKPDLRISGRPVEVYKPDGSLLLRYVPGVVGREATRDALGALSTLRWDSVKLRPTASGVKEEKLIRRDGTLSVGLAVQFKKYPDLREADSGIMGSFDRVRRFPWCRLTRFSRDHVERAALAMAVVRGVARAFEAYVPERYAVQSEWARHTNPAWVLPGTPFTTITVNVNFATAVHRDAGDLPEGFGCLTVLRGGTYSGGETVLPGAGIAVDMRDGDVLLYDVHEPHGNLPLAGRRGTYKRVAMVCYYRRKIIRCGSPDHELRRVQKRWGFGPLYTQEELRGEIDVRLAATTLNGNGHGAPTEAAVKAPAVQVADVVDHSQLSRLADFAAVEVMAGDIEPWAALIKELHRSGVVDVEGAHWLLTLYNTYDSIHSAWSCMRRWPSPGRWGVSEDRADAATYECTQERRNLRGGRVLKRHASYIERLGAFTQEAWILRGIGVGDPAANFRSLTEWLRQVWGVGRQSAFEWAEFVGKVRDLPVSAGDAQLWESEGPRRSLQRLYGNDRPDPQWLDDRAHECKLYLASRGVDLDWWDFETVICDFNVMRDGRYYPGRHLAALSEEIDSCPADDVALLREAFARVIPPGWRDIKPGIDPLKMPVYRDTGRLIVEP